jgi:isoleucyl-tRNA synthetase
MCAFARHSDPPGDAYRKLRNTFRYMPGNLAKFDPAADSVSPTSGGVGSWMLLRADDLAMRCRAWYET